VFNILTMFITISTQNKIPYSQGKPQKLDLPSLPLQPFKTYNRRRGTSGNS